jgi:CheY-like chemotaxis protein
MKTRLRMLIAEDNQDDAYLLEQAFARVPVAFHQIVGDGGEVQDYLERKGNYSDTKRYQTPNCFVIDLKMPRLDGFGLLHWLRNHSDYKCVPRIVITSSSDPRDISRAYDHGAHTTFIKPKRFSETTELIQSIGNYWLRAELFDSHTDRQQ